MPLESLMDERILQKLHKLFGDRFVGLNKHERMVLALALTENKINHERLRRAIPLHPTDITHILQSLTRLGMLVSDGYGRGTTYRLSGGQDEETLQANRETLQGSEDMVIPKRMSRDEMIKKILAFCTEWRTAE